VGLNNPVEALRHWASVRQLLDTLAETPESLAERAMVRASVGSEGNAPAENGRQSVPANGSTKNGTSQILGAEVHHDERTSAFYRVDQDLQDGIAPPIEPMEILEEDNRRLTFAPRLEDALDDFTTEGQQRQLRSGERLTEIPEISSS
jgi:hypothetical protein